VLGANAGGGSVAQIVASNIGSFVGTTNHWSDNVTSIAYVQDVVVPYFKAQCEVLGKVYGEQGGVMIADTWYGWQDKGFRHLVKKDFPWLKLVYVPGRCTPVGQPMDAGIIAMRKGDLRREFGGWAAGYVHNELTTHKDPSNIELPHDVPTCKHNLTVWLANGIGRMQPEKVAHCWESTKLLQAWDKNVQREAAAKAHVLFKGVPLPHAIIAAHTFVAVGDPDAQEHLVFAEEDLEPEQTDTGVGIVDDDDDDEDDLNMTIMDIVGHLLPNRLSE
jgi:hypothetical protein